MKYQATQDLLQLSQCKPCMVDSVYVSFILYAYFVLLTFDIETYKY